MIDKFDRMSIYDVDWKTTDNDGEEVSFTFKPLPFSFYPKLYGLLNKLSDSGMMDKGEGLSEEEQSKKFLSNLSPELVEELTFLEKEMVKNSYPDLTDDKVERFVTSNAFALMEPMMDLMNRQEKANPRKVQASLK